MSRTFKDKPRKLVHKNYYDDMEAIPFRCIVKYWGSEETVEVTRTWWKEVPGIKPKLKKAKDTEYHWMTTPGWWVKMTMTKPERRSAHLLEKKVLRIEDIEDADIPDLGRKPHIWFW